MSDDIIIVKEIVIMIKSILCEDVKLPPAGSTILFETIREMGSKFEDTTWDTHSVRIGDSTPESIIDACDELRKQANDDHHVYIEGFEHVRGPFYKVWIGS